MGISIKLINKGNQEGSHAKRSHSNRYKNNFLALRLTNPNDQNYVKRLLPDTSGSLVEKMPSLKAGECILVGDAVTIPSIVHIEECDPKPSSNDIPYLDLWKTEWKELDISAIKDEWLKI